MAALAMRVLAALLLEGDDLLALALLDDLGGHGGALDQRRAMLRRVAAQHQDFAQGDRAAGVADQLFDLQDVVLGHFVLLAAGADNREHDLKSLKKRVFPPDARLAGAAQYTDARSRVKASHKIYER